MAGRRDVTDIGNWWVALVTFERRDGSPTEFLPDHCQGAVGWMGCFVSDGAAVRDLIEASLNQMRLRLVEISKQVRAESFDDVEELDSHLAANIAALEQGRSVVWGTIRTYIADGEA